ncbi:MAG: efflux RND transporter periplasmic adaptor subunit [Candidatus Aminicenantes bacterium]|nr:efflux RND transporter periplasmic adaptor subunit [Candidatus Aminicenantes bacterium]
MKKKTIFGLIAILAVALVVFFVFIKKGKADQPKYRTEVLAKGDVEALVTTSGTINPVDIVDVGSQVSGKITKLYADYNSKVTAGQLMAELDQAIQQAKVESNQANYQSSLASLEQAKVTLENAKKKQDRTQDLFQRNLVSFEEKETADANFVNARVGVQTADARVSQAKSTLDQSKVDLSYCIIRSPINGTVIDRPVNVGQTVAASMTAPVLFKVASDLTKMKVQCAVDEADIGKVKEGQKVRFTVDAFQGETFTGIILQVRYAAVTTQNVVTYATIVDAPNPDVKLRPGMTATVSIITGEARGTLRIPNAAMRFTPALPQEELQKLLATLRPQGQRGGQPGEAAAAGQVGQKPDGAQTAPAGQTGAQATGQVGQRQGGQRGNFDPSTLTPEQLQRFQQMRAAGGSRRQGGTVWVLDELGQIKPYMVRTGITDNTYSEITRSELKEGMKIILGLEAAKGATTATPANQQGQRGPGGNMMFMGR